MAQLRDGGRAQPTGDRLGGPVFLDAARDTHIASANLVLWWETRKSEAILRRVEAMERKPWMDADQDGPLRARAVEQLLELSEHEEPDIRHAAVFALARMRASEATKRLLVIASDPQEEASVRFVAVIGLGLIDDLEARAMLADAGQAVDEVTTINWLAAIGLQEEIDDRQREVLLRLLRDPRSAEVQRMAAWALRMHGGEAVLPAVRDALLATQYPPLARELLLHLGRYGDGDDRELLLQVVLNQQAGGRLPVMNIGRRGVGDLQIVAGLALKKRAQQVGEAERRWITERLRPVFEPVGHEIVYARALLPIVLAEFGGARTDLLLEQLNNIHVIRRQRREQLTGQHSWVRGYAGLALARRMPHLEADAQQLDRFADPGLPAVIPGVAEVEHMFGRALGSPREATIYKVGVIIGLGLSGDHAAAEIILDNEDAIWGGGPMTHLNVGYATLALALLGRDEALEWAADYIGHDQTPLLGEDLDGHRWQPYYIAELLGRRSAVQALGVMGGEEGIELLRREWGGNAYVSLDVARAWRLAGYYEGADELLDLLESTDRLGLLQVGIWSIGEVLEDRSAGQRLRRVMRAYPHFETNSPLRSPLPWDGPIESDESIPIGTRQVVQRFEVDDRGALLTPLPDLPRLAEPFLFDVQLPLWKRLPAPRR